MTAETLPVPSRKLASAARITVFALVGLGHVMSHIYILALPPLFALIKSDLDIDYAALGLLVTVFHVATGLMQVPAGFLVDRIGARPTLVGGLVLCAAGIAGIGMVDGFWTMVILSTLAGVGNSVFHPADYAILAGTVEDRHLGKTFGFHLLAGNVGFAAAPLVMVSFAALWDWRGALIAVGAVGFTLAVAMLLFGGNLRSGVRLPRQAPASGQEGNGIRTFLSMPLVIMLGFFVLVAIANTGVQAFSVTILSTHYGMHIGTANTALTVYLSAGLGGIALGGWLADRLERPVTVVVISMLSCASCFVLLGVPALPVLVVLLSMGVAGAAVGAMRPARDLMVNAIAPPGETGKVFGFVGMGLSIGGAVAPVVLGAMIDIGATGWLFWLFAACILLSVTTALTIHRMAGNGASRTMHAT